MADADAIRAALQGLLDSLGDGYMLTQHVVVMALERVCDGEIEATCWYWSPPGHPDWMTAGLIDQAIDMRAAVDDM